MASPSEMARHDASASKGSLFSCVGLEGRRTEGIEKVARFSLNWVSLGNAGQVVKRRFLSVIFMVALAFGVHMKTSFSEGSGSPSVEVERPVARPSNGPHGAVFMTLKNFQSQEDRLVGVACAVCKVTEIHDHIQDGSYWRMRPVPFLELPAGQGSNPGVVSLASGGKHIMLLHLHRPLAQGDTFPIKLYFQKAPPLEVKVDVTENVPMASHPSPSA